VALMMMLVLMMIFTPIGRLLGSSTAIFYSINPNPNPDDDLGQDLKEDSLYAIYIIIVPILRYI